MHLWGWMWVTIIWPLTKCTCHISYKMCSSSSLGNTMFENAGKDLISDKHRSREGPAGLVFPSKIEHLNFLTSNLFTFIIILYFLISLFFISFFNYWEMVILIVYLSLEGLISLFAFIQLCYYFVISLGVFHILVIIFNEISVFIHLEAVTMRSSTSVI